MPHWTLSTAAWKKRATPARSSISSSRKPRSRSLSRDRPSIPSWPQPCALACTLPGQPRFLVFRCTLPTGSPFFLSSWLRCSHSLGSEFFPRVIFCFLNAAIPQSGFSWEFPASRAACFSQPASCRIGCRLSRALIPSPTRWTLCAPLCWEALASSALAPSRRLASLCGRALAALDERLCLVASPHQDHRHSHA